MIAHSWTYQHSGKPEKNQCYNTSMHPILWQWWGIRIPTNSIFIVLALWIPAFIFWRRGTEEHYDEIEFFDGMLLSSVVGICISRISFLMLNYASFGTNVLAWLNPIAYPGFLLLPGLVGAGIYLYYYSREKKWDQFELLDFWVVAIIAGVAVLEFGNFFQGTGFGMQVEPYLGVKTATSGEAELLPVPLILGWGLFLSVIYLYWVEYRYRTIEWYRGKHQSAQSGFVLACGMIIFGALYSMASLVRLGQYTVYGVFLDPYVYGIVCLLGIVIMILRSGIELPKRKSE